MTLVLAALGNLFSGFCGGAILSTYITIGTRGELDIILVYLVGCLLSFAALLKGRDFLRSKLPFLSLTASFLFLASPQMNSPAISFMLLAALFSLLFLPRSLRTEIVGEGSRYLSIAEFAYAAGYVIAMLDAFQMSGLGIVALSKAGAAVALTASIIDWLLSKRVQEADKKEPTPLPEVDTFAWGAITLVAASTVVCQISIQSLSSFLETTLPLAGFEIGVTLAPLAFSLIAASFVKGESLRSFKILLGRVYFALFSAEILVVALSTSTLVLVSQVSSTSLMALAAMSAFLYEFVCIALLQALGAYRGGITKALSVTGVVASAAYWTCNHIPLFAGAPYFALLGLGTFAILSLWLADCLSFRHRSDPIAGG